MPDLHPTPHQLNRLKAPLGHLIRGTPAQTMPELRKLVEELRPPKLVTVGDVVSREAMRAGIRVDLAIIDGKTMRKDYQNTIRMDPSSLRVRNLAGTIMDEAWAAIKNSLRESSVTIFVDGEEDLLTLPAVLEAPIGALVIYGQPSQGIVVVTVTSQKKAELNKLLASWKDHRNSAHNEKHR